MADARVSLAKFVGGNKTFFSANHALGYDHRAGVCTARNTQPTLKIRLKPARYYDIEYSKLVKRVHDVYFASLKQRKIHEK